MTREEAIKIIRKYECNKEHYDACEMLIKALEQEPVLDKIREEIEQIEINGHIRDVECFSAGINAALKIIDKHNTRKEVEK